MKHFSTEQATRAIQKTASLLVREGVRVTTQGARAYCEWKPDGSLSRINLPMIPRDASPEFLAALQGFLDHEVGHALYTRPRIARTLEEAFQKETSIPLEVVHGMFNVIEDVRIEACMERDYKGSKTNLHSVRGFFSDTFTKPNLDKLDRDNPANAADRRSYILPIYFRARGGQSAMIDFMDAEQLWDEVAMYDKKFPDLSARLAALASTEDAAELAFDILRTVRETKPPETPNDSEDKDEEEPEEPDDKDQDGDDEQDDEGEGASDGDDEPEDADEDDEGDDTGEAGDSESDDEEEGDHDSIGDSEDDDSEGEDDGDEAGDDAGESEGEAENSDDGDDAEGDPSDEGDDSDDESTGGADPETADGETEGGDDAAGELNMDYDPDKMADFDEAAADILESAITSLDTNDPYYIFTRDNDKIEPAPISKKPPNLDPWEKQVEITTGTLRRELQRLIAARTRAHHVSGYKRGRIHPGSLHRIKAGDDRVFSRKHEAVRKDTAFSLVVDLSGSMRHEKVHTALLAAWAFADTLDRLGVPCEVIGFTTKYIGTDHIRDNADYQRYISALGSDQRYVRWEPLNMPIFKGFNEKFGIDNKRRIASAESEIELANNVDGECVRIAAARLYQRREERKVMIVFSDGHPASFLHPGCLHEDLSKAVKEITAAGIETIGIGICDRSVEHFYPKHFVINKVADLATTTLRQLKEILAS